MGKRRTILLVEDNININAINRQALEMEGYHVLEAVTLKQARHRLQNHSIDLIVLDILLPDGSGLDFCRSLRETNPVPVLFLTAMGESRQIIEGLRGGGDDYLTKPYDIDAFIARIEALLRRVLLDRETRGKGERLVYGPLRLYPDKNRITVSGVDSNLTQREYALLWFLLRHSGRVFSVRTLYGELWDNGYEDGSATVRVHINMLRKKLNLVENPVLTLETEYGQGYRMVVRDG